MSSISPGWRWKGRDELERKLAAGYALMFRDTTLMIGVGDVRFPSPDIAVAHAAWTRRVRTRRRVFRSPGWQSDARLAKAGREMADSSVSEHGHQSGNALSRYTA